MVFRLCGFKDNERSYVCCKWQLFQCTLQFTHSTAQHACILSGHEYALCFHGWPVCFATTVSVLIESPHVLSISLCNVTGNVQQFLSSFAALQSPIEYQRKESSTAVLRPQAGRVAQPNSRPYSSVPVGSEKPLKATSRNPSLPPLKISTSNGSTGYEQPGDKYEQSKVLNSSDKT